MEWIVRYRKQCRVRRTPYTEKIPIFNPRSWPVVIKLQLTITIVVATVGFMIGPVMVVQDWGRFHDELEDKALLLSEFVAIPASTKMRRKNYWSLYLSLKNVAARRAAVVLKVKVVLL